MSKLILWIAALLVTMLVKVGFAQSDLSQAVPVDPELRTGVLDNGLTYYIRHNEEPKERASFYIIQNVGALLEEDNQNGLAHFLEHMAFNGTEHFEGKGILNTLEKHGVAFGRNINAYTSFNETVYNLSEVPSTNEGLIDTCLLVLHDWADQLLLTEEEINAERGVITEEWRTRRNASFRLRNQWFPVVFKGSKWAVRDVIGDTTVIRYHEPVTLRNFYHDWYRTDLQAIAIVGDINVDEIEAKVKALFSPIEAVANEKPRPIFTIPHHDETYYVLATDPEAPQSQISIFIPEENKDAKEKTLADLRESYLTSLYNTMSSLRIQELLQKGTPPFVNGSSRKGGFVRGYDVYSISATANPNEEAKALEAILIETERIKRFGFQEGELERAKINFLTSLESQYKQKDKIRNDSYCREYSGNYTSNEPIPGIEFEYNFANEVLPTITVDEISALAKQWIKADNRTIVITGPSEGVTHLTEKEAKAIVAKVEKMAIEPYVDAAASSSLISEDLKGSKVVSSKKLKDFDAVEWTLANNVKVIYRHADYEKDNVALKAFSKGGTSLWDNEYTPSADMTGTFINTYGVGDFDAITLQKMLTGKKVSLSPQIGDLTEGFSGSSTPKDFETMMQLVYLYFEKPRFDKEAHNALMSRYLAYVANMEKDPKKIMQDSLTAIVTNYNPRVRALNTKYLQDVNIETIEKIYKDRIQDAGDFTFIIVGNIDEDTVKIMSEKYLGSLTDSKREENWLDRGIDNPEGKTEKVIPISLTTPKANVNIRLVKDMEYSIKNALTMQVLEGILDLRYTETVREDEGGTYGVGIGGSVSQFPTSKASMRIAFDCDPARADKLKSIIFREIDKILAEGPTAVDFDKTIKNMLKDREQSKEHNGYWLSSLYSFYFSGINTASAANFEDILNTMNIKDVQDFAQKFFTDADLMDVVFVPKSE
ncbi:MAG: M16 family metallopeptidase [Prolixibacteraceae bacterium]